MRSFFSNKANHLRRRSTKDTTAVSEMHGDGIITFSGGIVAGVQSSSFSLLLGLVICVKLSFWLSAVSRFWKRSRIASLDGTSFVGGNRACRLECARNASRLMLVRGTPALNISKIERWKSSSRIACREKLIKFVQGWWESGEDSSQEQQSRRGLWPVQSGSQKVFECWKLSRIIPPTQ